MKLEGRRWNLGLMELWEGGGVMGDAAAATRAAPEVAVVMVEAAFVSGCVSWSGWCYEEDQVF